MANQKETPAVYNNNSNMIQCDKYSLGTILSAWIYILTL